MSDPLLVGHAATTFALVGLIWTIQVVHYPLMARVGAEAFPAYERAHLTRVTGLVAPLMLAEAALASALLLLDPSPLAVSGAVMLLAIWLSTGLVQAPLHARLEQGGLDPAVIRRLVRTNAVRTALWTARGGVAAALLLG